MLEKLGTDVIWSILIAGIGVMWLGLCLLLGYYALKVKKKVALTLVILVLFLSGLLVKFTGYELMLKVHDAKLFDIQSIVKVSGDELKIGSLPDNYRYKDNLFDRSKEQVFKVVIDNDLGKVYLSNKDNGKSIELSKEDATWVRVEQLKQ